MSHYDVHPKPLYKRPNFSHLALKMSTWQRCRRPPNISKKKTTGHHRAVSACAVAAHCHAWATPLANMCHVTSWWTN